jgi:uncharacterized protein (DUF849 family)
MLQVALNGNRTKREHPLVPVQIHEIAEEAVQACRAGADAIHFHVRDAAGRETVESSFVQEQLTFLREKLPGIPMGISTGEWIEPDFDKRLYHLRNWSVLPDFVSVNCYEAGFEKIVEACLEKGIAWEAGINSKDAAIKFVLSGLSDTPVRILIEPHEQDIAIALKSVSGIEQIIQKVRQETPVLLHGYDLTCWPLLQLSPEKDYSTRIGFEDTLFLPDGSKADTNAQLVEAALFYIQQKGNRIP